jgi:protein O-GlcNAc transferase
MSRLNSYPGKPDVSPRSASKSVTKLIPKPVTKSVKGPKRPTPAVSSTNPLSPGPGARVRARPLDAEAWSDLVRLHARRQQPWHFLRAAQQAVLVGGAGAVLPDDLAAYARQAAASLPDEGMLGHRQHPLSAAKAAEMELALAHDPQDWYSALYACRLRTMAQETIEATDAAEAARLMVVAQGIEFLPGETAHLLAKWSLAAGDAAGAVELLRPLVDLRPLRHGSMMLLGLALLEVGHTEAAELAFARASLSENPAFLTHLAERVFGRNYWREAIAVAQKVTRLKAKDPAAWCLLASLQAEAWQLEAAQASLQQAVQLDPAHSTIASVAERISGRSADPDAAFEDALRDFRKSNPLSRQASRLAMTSLYASRLDPVEVARLHRDVIAPIEAAAAKTMPRPAWSSARLQPDKRLRVGYVTGDLFRQHPVNLFMLPILLHHDTSTIDVVVYFTGTMVDSYTLQAQAAVTQWHSAGLWTDAQLHEQIRADGIDVLVDLGGHTASHRLGVFAMHAAPVQATYLGYPHSTGMQSIDWFIGDAVTAPFADAHLFSEGIAHLPGSVFCWSPVDDYALPEARSPDAGLVLGSFNNVSKLGEQTIALWSAVLKGLPQAKLLIKAAGADDALVQRRLLAGFAQHAVEASRIEFEGPSGLADMMACYGKVDFALDAFPYNGGTTTLQALWMGVPVVTLRGGNFVRSMGASFLTTLGRPEWIAQSTAHYVQRTQALVGELASHRSGRGRLRDQMQASPLCDIAGLTRHLEDLYAHMWQARCAPEMALPASLQRAGTSQQAM